MDARPLPSANRPVAFARGAEQAEARRSPAETKTDPPSDDFTPLS